MPRLTKLCVAKERGGRYYEVLECERAYKWKQWYREIVLFERHPLYSDILLFTFGRALKSGLTVVYSGRGIPIEGERVALCGVYGSSNPKYTIYDAGTHWLIYANFGSMFDKDRVNLVPKRLGVEGLGEALTELLFSIKTGRVSVLCNDRELEQKLSYISLMAELVAR